MEGGWIALRPQSLAPAPSFLGRLLVDFGWLFRPFHVNPPSLAFSRFFHVGVSVLRSKNANMLNYNPRTASSGGSSIEADKALPHPQSPRSNTLQYFYLQFSKMQFIVKENNIIKSKNIFWFRNFEF